MDDSFAPGIGRRLDGWPNRDLDIGAIVASAPDLSAYVKMLEVDEATVRKVLTSWDRANSTRSSTLTARRSVRTASRQQPSTGRLLAVNNHTWTGSWGTVTYWNACVANLEMHGKGNFFDPRLNNAEKYPVAARTRQSHKQDTEDRITPKLPALHFYQLSLPVPKPPADAYDVAAAARGEALFKDNARCATCHVPPVFTEPGWNLHKAEEIGIDDFQAKRAPDERYVTAKLRALWDTRKIHKGGFYHDGRFARLTDVVNHYDNHFQTSLTEGEKRI